MIYKIKRDLEENWAKAINFIPKEGEIILYDCGSTPKIKVGDGITKLIDLPFVEEEKNDSMSIHNIDRVEDEVIIIGGK